MMLIDTYPNEITERTVNYFLRICDAGAQPDPVPELHWVGQRSPNEFDGLEQLDVSKCRPAVRLLPQMRFVARLARPRWKTLCERHSNWGFVGKHSNCLNLPIYNLYQTILTKQNDKLQHGLKSWQHKIGVWLNMDSKSRSRSPRRIVQPRLLLPGQTRTWLKTTVFILSCFLFSFLSGLLTNDGSLRWISLKKMKRTSTPRRPTVFETNRYIQ